MVHSVNTRWDSVEQWSPTLFLIGGTLLVGHAAVQGIDAFTDLSPPPDVFVTVGHLIALLGLVGLYPVLADRTSVTARAAAVVAVVPLVGWTVMTSVKLLAVGGLVSSLTDTLPGPIIMLVVGSTILTYVLFGVATLRVGEGSRSVGLLVLSPAALIVVLLADAAVTGASAADGVFIGGGLALSMLALGYRLRSWSGSARRTAAAADVTMG